MELDRVRSALNRAAVRSQQRNDGPPRTTRDDLASWAKAHLSGRKLVVVSNREPYSHVHRADGVGWVRNAGGLTVALDAAMQAMGGTWVAHGSGDADRATVDDHDRVACPPDRPRYTLRRLWLSREDHARYYSGFSNGALWPLCHIAYVRPRFLLADWERYQEVNRRFAEAVVEEVGDQPAFVFVQDYHLALAAATLRERRPDLQTALFWHIPFPNAEVFRRLPWRREVLEGMLANDLVGFHIRHHAFNFLETVAETLEARVDYERLAIERGGRRTWVRHFPIGVDAEEIATLADSAAARESERELRARLGLEGCRVGLGVDRLDYTKGIPERLEALERLFEKHPDWVGRFAFIQIGVPSRVELKEYRDVLTRTRALARRINQRFSREAGPTVHLIGAGPLLPDGRLLRRHLAPRRHEPGRQGICGGFARPRRGTGALALHRRRSRARAGLDRHALRPRRSRRRLPRRALGAGGGAARAHGGAARDRAAPERIRLDHRGARFGGEPQLAHASGRTHGSAGGLKPFGGERQR